MAEQTDSEFQPPKKRRKKRRKPVEPSGVAAVPEGEKQALRPALDDDGRERPRFLLSFPEDPELEKLIVAYESGNYACVRTEAPGLIEASENEAVRLAASELRRRIDPDPLMKYLLLASAALLLVLAGWAYSTSAGFRDPPGSHEGHNH